MLDYTTFLDEKASILYINFSGTAEKKQTQELSYKFRKIAKDSDQRLLMDFSEVDISKITYLHLDRLFEEYYDKLDRELRQSPVALLFKDSDKQMVDFIKLSWEGEHILSKGFLLKSDAIKWLSEN